MKKTCGICVEQVNSSLFIKCHKCSNEYCHDCFKQYVNTLKNEVKCMCCSQTWDQSFIYRNLPPHLVYSVMKEKRTDLLFEQEKSMLPNVQLQLQQKKITADAEKEIAILKQRIIELRQISRPNYSHSTQNTVTNKIVCGCPLNECRGFITRPDYSCGMCSLNICKKCHKITNDDHECVNDDIETVKLILATTKPCPGCGAASKKTEGCSQVWCMVCKKAWNWNTGQLEYGAIHATDYLNYLRKNGQYVPRAAGDVIIDRCSIWHRFPLVIKSRNNVANNKLVKIYQKTAECNNCYNYPERVPNNTDIAMKYLEKKIDEKKWKALIIKRDKQHTFNTEITKMKEAFFYGLRDLFASYVLAKDESEWIRDIDSIFEFHNMMINEFNNLSRVFKSKKKCPFVIMV